MSQAEGNKQETLGELVLISEGGAHMLEYFISNGVYPNRVVLQPIKFKEIAPYLKEEDEVLLVINGFTDFSLDSIYELIRDLTDLEGKVKSIVVLSNMGLGKVDIEYYLYSGDLFYGDIKLVSGGKLFDVPDPDHTKSRRGRKKSSKDSEKSTEASTINAVVRRYLVYNRKDHSGRKIYGIETKQVQSDNLEETTARKLISVDLFQ